MVGRPTASPLLLVGQAPGDREPIAQFVRVDKLVEVIGRLHQVELQGSSIDVLRLPHPSGASTWHRMPPGKELLEQALQLLAGHPAWRALLHR